MLGLAIIISPRGEPTPNQPIQPFGFPVLKVRWIVLYELGKLFYIASAVHRVFVLHLTLILY